MAKKVIDENLIKEGVFDLVAEYFRYPISERFSFDVDIKKVSAEKRVETMTKLAQLCVKGKQDISVGIQSLGEIYTIGKNGEKIDE